MKILAINGGSSSFKFALYDVKHSFPQGLEPIWEKSVEFKSITQDRKSVIKNVLSEVPAEPDLIGHRIVHGGNFFQKPTILDAETKKILKQISPLAPLHNPINLEGLEVAESYFPQAKQIGIFDTAFHSTMPEVAWTYPGPWKWREENIRRYGFHGISHQYCTEIVRDHLAPKCQRLITCHLGNGASCTAVWEGKSIDTTMGFTPMEGLMMGTRSGTIDPGIILYLLREKKLSYEQIDHCLNKESGLLGIGGAFDMREILKKTKAGDLHAKLAFDLYIYRLTQAIGALTASLQGLDAFCFTAGIGENSPEVREATLQGLKYMGVEIDPNLNKNIQEDGRISSPRSKIQAFVVHLREDWLIAEECFKIG